MSESTKDLKKQLADTEKELKIANKKYSNSLDMQNKNLEAQEALQVSETQYRRLFESAKDGILILDAKTGVIEDANPFVLELTEYTLEEMKGKRLWEIGLIADIVANKISFKDLLHREYVRYEDLPLKTKGGETVDVEFVSNVYQVGKRKVIQCNIRDITQRKLAEGLIHSTNRALETLTAVNRALVQAKNEKELLKSVVNIITKESGYSFAAVYYSKHDKKKTITPMVWSGSQNGFDCMKQMSWDEKSNHQMPVSKAIYSKKTQITPNIDAQKHYEPWREEALNQGYCSNIAFPLMDKNKVFGVLDIYSSAVEVLEKEEVLLLEQLASDLSYGIVAQRTILSHEKHDIRMRQSLEQSIETIAATIEARDPYTAGHQKHVSELATAIAEEMGLDKETVAGIRLAAIVHDLGKIHIPAEILSKPGKLSKIEFMLIMTHPQAGFDILKKIEFPWPIADIILQHHEKLDGSGYPLGLKSEEILMEAKIITVSDVVEAISSHRPYRASLGINVALDEIISKRGISYDATVVDACVKLFKEKKFHFER